MTKTLGIIGAGRVGRALGRRLQETGWRVMVVTASSEANAKKAVRFIGGGRPAAGIPARLAGVRVILLTVPDDAIAPIASELARQVPEELGGKVVLHTSGALDSSVLKPVRERGAAVGAMHPLQTFNGVSVPPLAGKVFAIEGDQAAVRTARRLVRSLGGVPMRIGSTKKPLYHAAGSFAVGLCLALEEAGVQMLSEAGLKRREAKRALLSLTRQMLEHYEKLGPRQAWTGPLARGDFGVVASHEDALGRLAPEFREAYHAVSRLAARVLSQKTETMLRELDGIWEKQRRVAKAKGGCE
jgi:predicted short-subunit dehydrogenase-like oxidoreductase (DUF2520 family)